MTVGMSFAVSVFGSALVWTLFPVHTFAPSSDLTPLPVLSTGTTASAPPPVPIDPSVVASAKTLEQTIKTIARNTSPSVVSIVISKDLPVFRTDPFGFFQEQQGMVHQQVGGGTGLFINKNGLILTNKHVVEDPQASYAVVLSDGREFSGSVVATDPVTDLAIVQAFTSDGKPLDGTRAATFVDSPDSVEIGSFVVAIGNALAQFQNTITFGIISGLNRTISAQNGDISSEQLSGLIQTDTPISPGNSG